MNCGVLIVEDDPDLREMIMQVLALEGFEPSVAENGRDALDYLSHHPHPHVILLDLMMPVMDGWQFRERQRHDPTIADIPVVVLSAVADRVQILNAAEVLSKPLDVDRLLSALRAHC